MKSLLRTLIVAFAERQFRSNAARFLRYYQRLPLSAQAWLAPRLSPELRPDANAGVINTQQILVSGPCLDVRSKPDGPYFTRSMAFAYPLHDRLTKQGLATLAHAAPGAQVFLDVGFNIGMLAIDVLAAQRQHRLIGFEANAALLPIASALYEALALPLPQIVSAAVSDTDGQKLSFYVSTSSYLSSFNQAHAAKEGQVQEIQTTTLSLDRFSVQLDQPVAAIKIDVEGAEVQVLLGAQALLKAQQSALFIEILPQTRTRCWEILVPLGYRLFSAERSFAPLDQAQFERSVDANFLALIPQSWQYQAILGNTRDL